MMNRVVNEKDYQRHIISYLVRQNGYIERKVDESDRRATLIFLTEKGEARANEIRDQREHRFDRLFGELSAEEKEQLLTLLRKMNKRSE